VITNNWLSKDYNGVYNEVRGKPTTYDHVTEMKQSVKALQDAIDRLNKSLGYKSAKDLNGTARSEIDAAIDRAKSTIDRMSRALGGEDMRSESDKIAAARAKALRAEGEIKGRGGFPGQPGRLGAPTGGPEDAEDH